MNLSFKLLLLLTIIFISIHVQAQNVKHGTLLGQIVDSKTGQGVIGAVVSVQDGAYAISTDAEGKYSLKIPEGTYTINISNIAYNTKSFQQITITENAIFKLNAVLEEKSNDLGEVVVQADAQKETEAMMLVMQRNAVAMTSNISAEFVAKTPDRTVADVVKRISGVSLVDDKFAVIRGLGDRYNTAYINGLPMPSTESDRKAFALDLIPIQLLDNISIIKTATPDMPGDFAGGFIQMNTKDVPIENKIFVNLGLQANSITTFKNFQESPQKSTTDFLGFDNGTRQIPTGTLSTTDAQSLLPSNKADGAILTDQTNLFNNKFASHTVSARPNIIFQAGGSKRWKMGNNEFGIIAMVSYTNYNKYTPYSNNNLTFKDAAPSPDAQPGADGGVGFKFNYDKYANSVQNTGMVNLSYKLGSHSKFYLRNLFILNGEDQTINKTGRQFLGDLYERINTFSYFYQQSKIYSGQLGGQHFLGNTKIKVDYVIGMNYINRLVPDNKRLNYSSFDGVSDSAAAKAPSMAGLTTDITGSRGGNPNASGRFFSNMSEQSVSANPSITFPMSDILSNLKVGGFYMGRSRNLNARNYLYAYNSNSVGQVSELEKLSPDSIFLPQNISSDKIYQYEVTDSTNHYSASSHLIAGYLMMDTKLFTRLKLVYGIRVEDFKQQLLGKGFGSSIGEVNTNVLDWLPSANIIYSITDKSNLRGSYSITVSRPEYRELAAFPFFDVSQNAIIIGNPDLQRAKIQNFDVKYEFFPAVGSLISFNPFVKQFATPIEAAVVQDDDIRKFTFSNIKAATSIGLETDIRFSFNKVDDWLSSSLFKDLQFFMNYAIIYSSVDLSDFKSRNPFGQQPTYSERPLQGQSPYVLNTGLQYSVSKLKLDILLTINRIGRRIAYAANDGRYIIWENPRTSVDFSINKVFFKKLQTRFIIGNLLHPDQIFYQDLNFNQDVKFVNNIYPFTEHTFEQGKDFETFRYKYGSTFTIMANYTF